MARGDSSYEFYDWAVQDVMSRAKTLGPEASLADAERLLEDNGWNAVPIVDQAERLLGIVTSLDLLRAFDYPDDVVLPRFREVMERPVSTVMVRDVQSVGPATPLSRVLHKIIDSRNKSFPVVENDRVVGMVSRHDVMHGLRRATGGHKPWAKGN